MLTDPSLPNGAEDPPTAFPDPEETFLQSLPATHPLKRGWESVTGVPVLNEDLVQARDRGHWLLSLTDDGAITQATAMSRLEARAWIAESFMPESLRFAVNEDWQELDTGWIESEFRKNRALLQLLSEIAGRHETENSRDGGTIAAGYYELVCDAHAALDQVLTQMTAHVASVYQLRDELATIQALRSAAPAEERRAA